MSVGCWQQAMTYQQMGSAHVFKVQTSRSCVLVVSELVARAFAFFRRVLLKSIIVYSSLCEPEPLTNDHT